MNRIMALIFGVVSYAIFFLTFLYMVGFVGGVVVPKTVDSGAAGPLGQALWINTALIALFGIQHSVMARPGFKARWTRIVPGPIERPIYVLASSAALIVLFWQWRPIPAPVWDVQTPVAHAALQALFFGGVGLVLYATFLIDHFDLFGLRQVFLYFRKKAYTEKRFMTPHLYKYLRHPLYVGWFTVVWATPTMSAGHFLLALGLSAYILLAIPMEERDLADVLGDDYEHWRKRTPAFVPGLRSPSASVVPVAGADRA